MNKFPTFFIQVRLETNQPLTETAVKRYLTTAISALDLGEIKFIQVIDDTSPLKIDKKT